MGCRGGAVSDFAGAGPRDSRLAADHAGVRRRSCHRMAGREGSLEDAARDRELHRQPPPAGRTRMADDLLRGGRFPKKVHRDPAR